MTIFYHLTEKYVSKSLLTKKTNGSKSCESALVVAVMLVTLADVEGEAVATTLNPPNLILMMISNFLRFQSQLTPLKLNKHSSNY
jgi:hypothetical protein